MLSVSHHDASGPEAPCRPRSGLESRLARQGKGQTKHPSKQSQFTSGSSFSSCIDYLERKNQALPKEHSVSYSLSILDRSLLIGALSGTPREFPFSLPRSI